MKNNISLNPHQIIQAFSGFMYRYHVLVFSLLVLGGLSVATYTLYQTVVSSQSAEVTASQTRFDSATIEKIKKLRDSNDTAAPLERPAGRSNPFQE